MFSILIRLRKVFLFLFLFSVVCFSQSSTWQVLNSGVNNIYIANNGKIVVAQHGLGILISSNNGETWDQKVEGINERFVRCMVSNDFGTIFVGTYTDKYPSMGGGSIYSSTDVGNSWTKLNISGNIRTIAVNSQNQLFAGIYDFGGLYKSNDNGITWNHMTFPYDYIREITINDLDHIFVGTSDFAIYRSTDNGITWNSASNGITTMDVNTIVIKSSTTLFCGTFGGGVFKSTNNGDSWISVNNDLTDNQIYDLVVAKNGTLYAATPTGIFSSTNNGDNWYNITTDVKSEFFTTLSFDNQGFLYAGTLSGEIFKTISPLTSTIQRPNEDIPKLYNLSQNYPNPFNPTTKIEFVIPLSNNVSLKVFDINGREVLTLFEGYLNAGKYSFTLNKNNLASGTYYYQLISGDFKETKKIVLLK
mgnify:CR=1 FL=1